MADSNGWKAWALAAVTGLLIGSFGGGWYGASAAEKVEVRLNTKIVKLESDEAKNYEIIIAMAQRLIRIETMVEAIKEDRE